MLDHFATLDVARRPWLEPAALKETYHRASAEQHPDRTGSDGAAAALNAAYGVLREPASRVRHLLELEQPEALAGRTGPNGALAETFLRLATLRRATDTFVKQLDGGATPLAQALLAPERFALQRDVEKEVAELAAAEAAALGRLRSLDLAWDQGTEERYAMLAEVHQELAFLTKWMAQLREVRFRLNP